jgi:hypothetical protein
LIVYFLSLLFDAAHLEFGAEPSGSAEVRQGGEKVSSEIILLNIPRIYAARVEEILSNLTLFLTVERFDEDRFSIHLIGLEKE